MNQEKKKRSFWLKLGRIVAKAVLYTILFFLILLLMLQTSPVQQLVSRKVVAWLERKLQTRVEVKKVYIGLSGDIVLEKIYLEDRTRDTLLAGGLVKANLNLWQLIRNQDVYIKNISFENVTAKISRGLPDTAFNYQFIVDAFTPASATGNTDSSAAVIDIKYLQLDKVRLLYKDVVTGSDVDAWVDHLDSRIDKLDPAHLQFEIPTTRIKGMTTRIHQVKPLASPEPEAKDIAEAKDPLQLAVDFKTVSLEQCSFTYTNDVSAVYTDFIVGAIQISPNDIDLANRIIDLKDLSIDNTSASIRLGRKEEARIVEKEAEQEVKSQAEAGWRILIGTIDLNNNKFRFDNDNHGRVTGSMDYAHLNGDSINLQANDIQISMDTISGIISHASFTEHSGFVLNELRTHFLYSGNETYLRDLYLKTPGTELRRSAAIRYASIESLSNDIGNMGIDLDLQDSRLHVKDLLTFAPSLRQVPAFAFPDAVWYINSRITGRLEYMDIAGLQLRGLNDTRVDISGSISGLPRMNNFYANLDIRNISTSRRDVQLFVPSSLLPSNVRLPARIRLNGQLKGNSGTVHTDLSMASDLGNARLTGDIRNPGNLSAIGYNATIQTRGLNIGAIISNKELEGPVSATFTAKGTGLDPKTADASFRGIVHAVTIKNYTYRNLKLDGRVARQKATAETSLVDPNAHFALHLDADLSQRYPAVQVNGMIDSLKLQPLHFSTERMIVRGRINADFPVTNPDDLQGQLYFTQAIFVQNEQRLALDTMKLIAGRNDSIHYLQLFSDVMNAELKGQYRLTNLGNIFQQAIQPYFAIAPGKTVATNDPYDFTLNAYVIDNPALRFFIPDLKKIDSLTLQSHFTSGGRWTAQVQAPVINTDLYQIRGLQLNAEADGTEVRFLSSLGSFQSGKNIRLDNTSIRALLKDNTIDFSLNNKDRNSKDKYNIKGIINQPSAGNYQLTLRNDSLVLNYDTWAVSPDNRIIMNNNGFYANNFVLSKDGQKLSINSSSNAANAPLEMNFSNFSLVTITGFVQTDSSFANGTIDGKISFTDLAREPVFIGDLVIKDFSFKGDTVGNVHMLVNNRIQNTYATDITLTGRGNDVKLTGNYYVRPASSDFDLDLNIRNLNLASVQGLIQDQVSGASGAVNGKFDLTGSLGKPFITGNLNFDKAGFTFNMLNSYFTIDGERIKLDGEGFKFDRFEIKDSAQNTLVVNGVAATTNFTNYRFDLDIRAQDFRALNSTKRNNALFYGQLYFNTHLKVRGTESSPVVDGDLTVNDKTKMTVVIPQNEPGMVARDGIVEFVDMDAPFNDSLFLAAYDSLNSSGFVGMDVAVNVEVVRDAEFNIIIDEGNGDFLRVKGEALLTAGIDPSGKINLSGSYELDQGSYELTFNFLKRRFDIQKGSRIVWDGAPTSATLDVEAIYVANAAPIDLVKDQLSDASAFTRNTYLQKIPFDVHLDMEGDLLRPAITFDIILPEKSYVVAGDIITNVRTRLDQLRQEPGEMNKQVFSLLLLNRFVGENPFQSSSSGPNPAALARQSVSKLLTEQLNRLAEDLIAGVDLSFDVLSSEDYTTGERRDRTDLNVQLSKRLLNDRLTVSIGSNFELEGPQQSNQGASNIAGNVALDYRISRDNRYLLRAYRKNEYQGAIEGYIIETGVSFVINVDYNRFRQIFMSKKEREERRQRRQRQRELNEQQKSQPAATTTAAEK